MAERGERGNWACFCSRRRRRRGHSRKGPLLIAEPDEAGHEALPVRTSPTRCASSCPWRTNRRAGAALFQTSGVSRGSAGLVRPASSLGRGPPRLPRRQGFRASRPRAVCRASRPPRPSRSGGRRGHHPARPNHGAPAEVQSSQLKPRPSPRPGVGLPNAVVGFRRHAFQKGRSPPAPGEADFSRERRFVHCPLSKHRHKGSGRGRRDFPPPGGYVSMGCLFSFSAFPAVSVGVSGVRHRLLRSTPWSRRRLARLERKNRKKKRTPRYSGAFKVREFMWSQWSDQLDRIWQIGPSRPA